MEKKLSSSMLILELTDNDLEELFDAMCVVGIPDRGPDGEGWYSDARRAVADKISALWHERHKDQLTK